jgi:hypothetical protein
VLGPRLLPAVAALALVTIGWSRTGADGGGLVVYAVAFAVLWLRLADVRLSRRGLLLALVGAGALGVALAALDALTGGSSHVTSALGSGPGSLLDTTLHRWDVSWSGATNSLGSALQCLGSLAGLAVLAFLRSRSAALDALLCGLAVSLLVNDTPQDVLTLGALTGASLWAWEWLRPEPRRREVFVFRPAPRASS